MTNLKVFEKDNYKVSVIVLNGKPMFNLKDVALILDIKNYRDSISGWKEVYVRKLTNNDIFSNVGSADNRKLHNTGELFLTEAGLYKLIFKSRKPEAEKFQLWVTNEVLPTIRKTGGYINDDEVFIETYFSSIPEENKEILRMTLKNVREMDKKIKVLEPKGKYYDDMVDRNHLTSIRDTAKELGVPERKFVKWLLENKFLYRDKHQQLKAYAEYIWKEELFEYRDWKGENKTGVQLMFTIKGKTFFLDLIKSGKLNLEK